MALFETIMIIFAVLIVLLMGFFIYVLRAWLRDGFKYLGEKVEYCDTKLGYIKGAAQDISKQLDNIKNDITDDRRDIVAMLKSIDDVVDTMHRNICADVAEKMVDMAFPIKEGEPLEKPFDNPFIPSGATTWPPCYVGGPCTNPHRDCINCPRPNVSGGTWTTTSNKVELTDNDKSANSVSITEGRTDVTDGTLPDGAIIMQ